MRVLIVGGTGFLGYHAARELLGRGHEVTLVGLPPGPPAGLFPDSVSVQLLDLARLSEADLDDLTTGYESVVFAAGADDRVTPESPAARFFYHANVKSSVRFCAASLRSGVKRFVLLGSYFTHFDREWPHLKLSEHHPYIESRRQQQELCRAIAGPKMAFVALELPYIFGSMPGVVPLWEPIVNYVRSGVPLYYTHGGSNMVAVQSVAQAIAGACEKVDETHVFQVGDRNVEWTEFLQGLCTIIERRDNKVHILPDGSLGKLSWLLDVLHAVQGKESGLHAAHFARIQTSRAFFDVEESRRALGYQVGGLEQAWRDTVAACPVEPKKSHWKTFSEKAKHLIATH